MTREELVPLKLAWIGYRVTHRHAPPMENVIDALESAWDRVALTDNNLNSALSANYGLQGKLEAAWHRIDEVEQQNLDLTVERDALKQQVRELEDRIESWKQAEIEARDREP